MHRTTAQKIRTNFKPRQAYLLQHSNSKAPVELEPKFGQVIHKTKPTYYNTAIPRLSGAGAKIWSKNTQDKAYILQHSYSQTSVLLEPNFGQIIHKTKPTHYNTATPRLQWSWSQNLVKLHTRQSLHTTTQLLPDFSVVRAKFWSNYTQDKPTYYNTATPRLQWSCSQNFVKLYTRHSLPTTTQLLQGPSGAGAKIWSNYTQDKAYTLQHSYSKAPVELEPKFGQIIHKT